MTPRPSDIRPARGERLLVLAYGHGLGDSVLALPFLRGLREARPAARFVLATTAPTAAWFADAGIVDAAIALSPGRLWRAWRALRAVRFDAVVDLRLDHTVQSAAFARLLGASRTVGFACPARRWFFTETVPADYRGAHHVDNLRRLAAALGAAWRDAPPPISDAARARAAALLATAGIDPARPLAVLAPGGRDDLARLDKRWPADRFGESGKRLRAAGFAVAVTGSAGERNLCARVAATSGGENLSGRTSCEELAAVLARARLLIGNNSGPVHLADALGVPTVSFSGGVHLVHWRPRGRAARVLLRDGACRDDLCRTCPDRGDRCLSAVPVDRVIGEALRAAALPVSPS